MAVALVAVLTGGCRREDRAPRFRNLVVVLVDTLRSDHLPSYGYGRDTAPFLAGLARQGVQVQGWAPTSWTRPSVTTVLTGLQPQRHQTITRGDALSEKVPFLPSLLAERGFFTVGFFGNGNAGRAQGLTRGFRKFRQSRVQGKLDGGRVTERALGLVEGVKPPYFLWVHYLDPHDPYEPPRSWAGAAPPRVQPQAMLEQHVPLTGDDVQALVDAYDGEIQDVDAAIRRLVEGLDRAGLLEDTLVVVTADHGEEFGEHGLLTHGLTLHEEVLRVPLLFWAKKGLSPARSAAVFGLVDLAPTLLAAVGAPVPEKLDGVSQWPAVLGAGLAPRPLLASLDLDHRAALALLDGPKKYLHRNTDPGELLYDLAADPGERAPLAASAEELAAWRLRAVREHDRLLAKAYPRGASQTHGELLKQLQALGYVGANTSQKELEQRTMPPKLGPEGLTEVKRWDPPVRVPEAASGAHRPD